MDWLKKKGVGILLCVALALPAWFLGRLVPMIGGPVAGILLGMLVAFIPRGHRWDEGIRLCSKKVLQLSIVLIGFDMSFNNIIQTGGQSIVIILSSIGVALLAAFLIGKLVKIPANTGTLIGVGTAICGGSAIAATAPVIEADDEEVAKAISTIFLFNIAAAFLFPALGALMGMTDQVFGVWAGTAVNDTSSVVAVATAWASRVGNDTALELATAVKLTRTLFIIPITLVLAVWRAKTRKNQGKGYSIAKIFPWFVLFFLLAAVIGSFTGLPASVAKGLSTAGKFCITVAMVAIGLNTNLVNLVRNGGKSILLGFCCWILVALSSLLMMRVVGIW